MKNKKTKMAATATLAILLALLALPLLTAPTNSAATLSTLTTSQTTAADLSAKMPEWNPINGVLTSGVIDLDMDVPFTGFGRFTPCDGRNMAFGLNMAMLIEFNDTNDNGVYDPGEPVLQEISLKDDFTWGAFVMSLDPAHELNISIEGSHKTSSLTVTITLHVYINSAVITLPPGGTGDIDTTVPGKSAVKIDIKIENFPWSTPPGDSLALVIVLDEEAESGCDPHLFNIGGTLVDSTDNAAGVIAQLNPDESEIYIVTPVGTIHAVFNWLNYAYRSGSVNQAVTVSASYKVNGTDDGLYLYLCVDNFGADSLEFDPYLALAQESQINLLPLLLIGYISSTQQTQMVTLGAIGAITLVGLAAAVIYIRRR
ncbi:MAG: hypothetical protein ACTSSA_07030 [Candidatus Freyarchaeota archaeon]